MLNKSSYHFEAFIMWFFCEPFCDKFKISINIIENIQFHYWPYFIDIYINIPNTNTKNTCESEAMVKVTYYKGI